MKLLDLFSGIGGFSLAARWANIETIQFVERDKFCQKVLMKNFPNVPIHDDIKTFNFYKDVDVLTGGFPCQPFSVAGKKKGLTDDRYLWPDMLRIIKQCRPRFIIAENVPGIIPLLDPILEDLERENYTWWAYLISASSLGAPHKRERLWVIAHCNRERFNERNNYRKKRYIQDDWERNIEKIQSEWPQFIPKSWKTFNAQEWLGFATNSDSQQCNEGTENQKSFSQRHEWQKSTRTNRHDSVKKQSVFNWEEDKPPVPGMDDGISHRVDRNKSLGNSIVPQIAYIFLKSITMILNNSMRIE